MHVSVRTASYSVNTHSHVRFRDQDDYDATGATIAYLTLPRPVTCARKWEHAHPDYAYDYGHDYECGTAYGLPVEIGRPQTQKSLQRFAHALKILDLEVFIHESQADQPDQVLMAEAPVISSDEKITATTLQTCPRLTLLTDFNNLERAQ